MLGLFKKIDSFIERISVLGLVISVLIILIFALLNIISRWMNLAFLWIDPLIRHLVFLCAFLGGVIATGRGTHVGIDIVSKFLENRNQIKIQKLVSIVILLASISTLFWLIYASFVLLKTEFEFGKPQFLGIHSAYLVSIIPLGFILIAYRFFYKLVATLQSILGDKSC